MDDPKGMECGPRGDYRFILNGEVVDFDKEGHCSSCVIKNEDYFEGGEGSLENPYYLLYQYGSPTEPDQETNYHWFNIHWERNNKSGVQLGKVSRSIPHSQISFKHVRQSVRNVIRGDYCFRLHLRSQCMYDAKQEESIIFQQDIPLVGKGTREEPYEFHIWFTDQL